jgi:hypothetical protein
MKMGVTTRSIEKFTNGQKDWGEADLCVARRPLTAPSVEVKEQIDQWIWTTKKSEWLYCIWDIHPSSKEAEQEWFKAQLKVFYYNGSRKLENY